RDRNNRKACSGHVLRHGGAGVKATCRIRLLRRGRTAIQDARDRERRDRDQRAGRAAGDWQHPGPEPPARGPRTATSGHEPGAYRRELRGVPPESVERIGERTTRRVLVRRALVGGLVVVLAVPHALASVMTHRCRTAAPFAACMAARPGVPALVVPRLRAVL